MGHHIDRNQTYLLFAFTISTAGDWLYRLALPLLVLQLTGSAVGAASAYALEYLPYLFFSLVGGVAADRVNRLRLLIGTDLGSAVTVAALAGVIASGLAQVWLIFLVAFALSSLRPVYHPAFQGLLPSIVSANGLAAVNARVQAIDSVFVFAGPVLGIGVVAALGTTTALWLDAGSFLLSALALAGIRPTASTPSSAGSEKPAARPRVRDDLIEAVQYVRSDRVILTGSLVMTGSAAGLMMVEANLIFYVVRLLALPVAFVGVVLGANGLGALLGAFAAPRLLGRYPPGRLIVTALSAAAGFTGVLALTANVAAIATAWAGVGACVTVIVVAWFTLRQRTVPERLLGRVVAISRALAFAAIPLGALLGAWLMSAQGVGLTMLVSVAIQGAVAFAAFGTTLGTARFPAPATQT